MTRHTASHITLATLIAAACAALAGLGCAPEPGGPPDRAPEVAVAVQGVTNGCGVGACTMFQTCGAWDQSHPGDGAGYTVAAPWSEGVGGYSSTCWGGGRCDYQSCAYGSCYYCSATPGVSPGCDNYLLFNRFPDVAANRRNELIGSRPGITTPALNGLAVTAQYNFQGCDSSPDCEQGDSPSCTETCSTDVVNQITGYPTASFGGPHACGDCLQHQSISCLGHPVVAGGAGHTCALIGTSMQCWGSDTRGQLGDNSTTQSPARVTVSNLSGALQASADGGQHSCAILGGVTRCWGANDHGQLGNGDPMKAEQHTPVSVTGLPGPRAQAITAGDLHSCAIVDGGAWCWGFNGNGQLGTGATTPADNTAAQAVSGLGSGVQVLAAGSSHTCAVVSGAARCWGDNSGGQLGIVPGDGSPPPAQTTTAQTVSSLSTGVQTIVAGIHHSCALLTSGGVKCWGSNDLGQLGNAPSGGSPPQTRSDAPVDVTGLSSGVTALIAGTNHTCALLAAGTVKCWGNNAVGQLGAGASVPLTFSGFPVAVTNLTGVQALGVGFQHTCAVGSGVSCWGSNGSAQLGMPVSSGMFSTTPVAISGVTCTGTGAALQCSAPGVP